MQEKKLTTETASKYTNLDKMSVAEVLTSINNEDQTVALSVQKELPAIEKLIEAVIAKMVKGGRLFYLGAGTSGRLGIVDASECPPTYGVPHGLVVGIIAGGDGAIRKAVEFAEDDVNQAWKDLQEHDINHNDFVIGITASGTTPYCVGAMQDCKQHGVSTGSIACNKNSVIGSEADYPIDIEVGPELVTGSTRMKSGTAQKMVLNMITTTVMIRLGKIIGNKMVDMQLSNNKLVDRGTRMLMEELKLDYQTANALLLKHGSVRKAMKIYKP